MIVGAGEIEGAAVTADSLVAAAGELTVERGELRNQKAPASTAATTRDAATSDRFIVLQS
jgi:hypothetical protein